VETAKTYTCSKAECTARTATPATVPASGVAGLPATEGSTTAAAFTCSIEANEKDKTEKISLTGSPEGTPTNGSTSVFKVDIAGKSESLSCQVTIKVAAVPPKIEPKPVTPALSGPAQQNPGPPRTQIRGSSDTSAVGIK
jgi:hypothetical protein